MITLYRLNWRTLIFANVPQTRPQSDAVVILALTSTVSSKGFHYHKC